MVHVEVAEGIEQHQPSPCRSAMARIVDVTRPSRHSQQGGCRWQRRAALPPRHRGPARATLRRVERTFCGGSGVSAGVSLRRAAPVDRSPRHGSRRSTYPDGTHPRRKTSYCKSAGRFVAWQHDPSASVAGSSCAGCHRQSHRPEQAQNGQADPRYEPAPRTTIGSASGIDSSEFDSR